MTWTAKSPVLVRGFGTPEEPAVPTRRAADGTEEMIIPGSALHGAVRALYEAATGSCLRVFDPDFVPVYRMPPDPSAQQLRLALVEFPEGADEPRLRLCAEGDPVQDRLRQEVLQRLHERVPGGLRSGARLRSADSPDGFRVDPEGEWVVFISDSAARDRRKPYYAAIRKLSDEVVDVPTDVLNRYREAVAGADDLRPARLAQMADSEPFVEVTHIHNEREYTVGKRSLAGEKLRPGQAVWVRMAGRAVQAVQLSQIWRARGSGPAGDRAPGRGPCTRNDDLCPACALFGSADVSGDPADLKVAAQQSYRGHVRFTDAVAAAGTRFERVTLPPMGSPRPGSGQFYLENGRPGVIGNVGAPALREWGSAADRGTPRPLRGRKAYWHTKVPNGLVPRRGKQVDDRDSSMVSKGVYYKIKSRFTATVTFTDLTEEQVGGLVVALAPSEAFGAESVLHLGGGRPLGYGSCESTIALERSWMTTAHDRYRGTVRTALDADTKAALVDTFTQTLDADTRTALSTVLRWGAVHPDKVGYPPHPHPRESEGDKTFAFWKQGSGLQHGDDANPHNRRGYPLNPLPHVTEDPEMPAVTRAEPKPVRRPPPGRPVLPRRSNGGRGR